LEEFEHGFPVLEELLLTQTPLSARLELHHTQLQESRADLKIIFSDPELDEGNN
jgi:hypothetical protein